MMVTHECLAVVKWCYAMRSNPDSDFYLGFTLIEVLIAVVILAVAVLAWMSTHQSAVLTRGQSRTMTVATELVQAKVEELSLRPAKVCDPVSFCNGQEEITLGRFTYTIQWHLERMESSDDTPTALDIRPFWEVFVSADWKYRGNKSFSTTRLVMEQGS